MNTNDANGWTSEIITFLDVADGISARLFARLIPRLRLLNPSTLGQLKTELRKFNMATGEWKP